MVANLVLRFDVVLLHLLQGEPHRVLVVGRHHHPHPLWEGESTTSLNLVSIKHKQGKIVSEVLISCLSKGFSMQFKQQYVH